MNEIPQINDVPARFLYEKRKEGLTGLYRPSENSLRRFKRVLNTIWNDFREDIERSPHAPVVGIFCYCATECEYSFSGNDGITTPFGGGYYIGIDKSALIDDTDYLTFLVIHELAHALCGSGHTPHYEAKLNLMLMQYNHIHGTELKNDLISFNDEGR